jgi:hypothetical protein
LGQVPELDHLEEALRRTGDSLEEMIRDGSTKQATLKEIFGINNEIGRMAREFPSMGPALREMQLEVNFVTIQVKRSELNLARDGLERVTSSLAKLRDVQTTAGGD